MAEVRPMENHEVGLFQPVRELLDPERQQALRAAGEYLLQALEVEGGVPERPLVVELDGGVTATQYFMFLRTE